MSDKPGERNPALFEDELAQHAWRAETRMHGPGDSDLLARILGVLCDIDRLLRERGGR